MSGLAWVDAAVREEATRQGYTTPAFLNCSAWQTLARRKPILDRKRASDRGPSLARMWAGKEEGEAPPQEWSDQEIAVRVVVREAIYYTRTGFRTYTKKEVAEEANTLLRYAEQLRAIAESIRRQEGDAHAANLEQAARYCEKQAEWDEDDPERIEIRALFLTKRRQGDPHVRGYCAMLADTIRLIYGLTMRGCVAKIANCALGRSTLSARTYSSMD
jgi:hypothetical protein